MTLQVRFWGPSWTNCRRRWLHWYGVRVCSTLSSSTRRSTRWKSAVRWRTRVCWPNRPTDTLFAWPRRSSSPRSRSTSASTSSRRSSLGRRSELIEKALNLSDEVIIIAGDIIQRLGECFIRLESIFHHQYGRKYVNGDAIFLIVLRIRLRSK